MFKVTGSLLGSWNIKVTEGTSSGWGKGETGGGGIANTTIGQQSPYRCGFYTGESVQGHMARQWHVGS